MTTRRALLFLLLLALAPARAAEVPEAIAGVRRDLEAARADLAALQSATDTQRRALRAAIEQTERQLADTTAKAQAEQRREDELRAALAAERTRLAAGRRELAAAYGLLKDARQELEGAFRLTLGPAATRRAFDAELLAPAAPDQQPALAAELCGLAARHLALAASMAPEPATLILPDGGSATGTLVRCGALGGAGTVTVGGRERAGLATLDPATGAWRLHPDGLARADRRHVAAVLAGRDAVAWLPLDLNDGQALARIEQRGTFWDWLRAGGPVMVPLALVALLGLLMILERAIFLTRTDRDVDALLAAVSPRVRAGDFAGAATLVAQGGGPVRRVLRAGIEHGQRRVANLDEALQEAILAELPTLERFLGGLAVAAAVAPLLGLLGTVTGMINLFQVITVHGTGNARLLSGGISEALITTEAGLIIAIPLLLAHAWLSRQVRNLVSHMDRAAIVLINAIREAQRE